MSAHDRTVKVFQLGTTAYPQVHKLQQRLQAQRRAEAGEDTLLLTEHRPVLTLGRSHPVPDIKAGADTSRLQEIDIIQTERGGDITYHGPGQLVAYGIIDLKGWELSVLDYVTGLEDAVMGVLDDWGARGERVPGARGVWVDGRKIASVGLNVRKWVTMHGIALNVAPNMAHFDLINPCGMNDIEMTCLSDELRKPISISAVAEAFVYHFSRVFQCTAQEMDVKAKVAAR
jgi:lipoyl synthase